MGMIVPIIESPHGDHRADRPATKAKKRLATIARDHSAGTKRDEPRPTAVTVAYRTRASLGLGIEDGPPGAATSWLPPARILTRTVGADTLNPSLTLAQRQDGHD
jgi:hypothetical protein